MSDQTKESEGKVARRRFCQAVGVSAGVVAVGGAASLTADFLHPRVLFEPASSFAVGPPETIEIGSVLTESAQHVYVMRAATGFRALSSVCTHLGCITRYRPDEKIIACPCHGSRFNLDGDVIAGPAPRPLPWFKMDLSVQGEIIVDKATEVPQGTIYKL